MPEPKIIQKFEADLCGPETTQLEIHLWCLKQGEAWLKKQGRTSFYHHKEAQKLLWPKHDHHRWSDLILQTYCEEEISVVMGCGDSSKTWTMATIILIDYWTDPDNTLWLVSTTEGRGSELRIWGVIKDLFNDARKQYEFLEGSPIDYLKTITTDTLDDEKRESREARSLRRGIMVIPCFPSGTMVDTPAGKRAIEQLRVGDFVFHAGGVGRIRETHSRRAQQLVRVCLSDGREIDCTPEHPFLTDRGWIKAIDLERFDEVLSPCETLRILRHEIHSPSEVLQSKVLRRRLQGPSTSKELPSMRKRVSPLEQSERQISQRQFLQHALRWALGGGAKKSHQEENYRLRKLWQDYEDGPLQPIVLLCGVSESSSTVAVSAMWAGVHINSSSSRKGTESFLRCLLQEELERSLVCQTQDNSDPRGNDGLEAVSRIGPSPSHPNGDSENQWCLQVVSNRRGIPGHKAGRGSGRWSSPYPGESGQGQNQNGIPALAWVDSVAILESGSDPRFEKCEGGYLVHNLEVEGHPSYSVNGVIVHNCKTGGVVSGLAPYIGIKAPRLRHAGDEVPAMSDSFLNAYSNWYGKEDFKGMMTGNFMETDDPMGVASEPECGWDLWEDTGKTQTWRSKFYNAKVVALDGRDSPNFDFAPSPSGRQKYTYLIGPKKLKGVEETKGKNSWEWWSQCVGKPAKGADIWRVLTKDFCLRHHATDDVIWMDDKILNLYALDPAYGGGDRCVGRQIQLGKRLDGVQTLLAHPPDIIPIRLGIEIDAEAQIAAYVYHRAKELKIAAKDIFYDSFGRGTLGFEFAKLFGLDCPVPVDSGAQPTARPVRFDLFVEERDGTRRLKRCDEHYSKFISEMYFSVYEGIDSDQIRGLDTETIREGCSRKFTKNKRGDNKIEVEPKDDYKERNRGQSPDLMDNFVIGVEGARRRGFKIIRLGADVESKKPKPKNSDLDTWLEEKSEHDKAYELQLT